MMIAFKSSFSEHHQPLLLIEKAADVKQLRVVESAGVIIVRYDKGATLVFVEQCFPNSHGPKMK